MKMTPIWEKIDLVRKELVLRNDAVNPHFGNEYVSLGSILASLNPLLEKHRLLLTQGAGVNENGHAYIETSIRDLETCETCISRWPLVIDPNAQKTASASTYARRYSLLCLFALTATDDDGESTAGRGDGRQYGKGAKDLLKRLK